MSIGQAQITLSDTTAALIVGKDNMPHDVILHNQSKSSNNFVFIGNADVTTSNGMHIDPGQTIYLTIPPNDELYAVSDPDGLVVAVTDIRKNG